MYAVKHMYIVYIHVYKQIYFLFSASQISTSWKVSKKFKQPENKTKIVKRKEKERNTDRTPHVTTPEADVEGTTSQNEAISISSHIPQHHHHLSLFFMLSYQKSFDFFFWHWKQTSYPSLIWQIWKWYHYI